MPDRNNIPTSSQARKQERSPPEFWADHDVFSDPDFPLGVGVVFDHPDLGPHRHEFTEVVIVRDGIGQHLFQDDVHSLCAGDVLIIRDGRSHGYRNTSKLRLINLMFQEPFILKRAPEFVELPGYRELFLEEPRFRQRHPYGNRIRLGPDELVPVCSLLDAMSEELKKRQAGFQLMALAHFQAFMVTIGRISNREPFPGRASLARVGRAVSYLENAYREQIELRQLEEITHLSTRSLLRHFKAATGLSPVQYLARVRMARACKLLQETSLSATEVAFEIGYLDSNYFSRQFKALMGQSPLAFRKRDRSQD